MPVSNFEQFWFELNNVRYRGGWAARARYIEGDLVKVNAIWYSALVDHVSGESFAVDLETGNWRPSPDKLCEIVSTSEFASTQEAITWGRANNFKIRAPNKLVQHEAGLVIENQTHVDGAFILEGEGWHSSPTMGGTCFQYTGSGSPALSIQGATTNNQDGTFRLSDFAVHGATSTTGNSVGTRGIDAKILNNALLDNLFIGYHGGAGFYGDLCYSLKFHRGLFFSNFGSGIELVNAANRVMVDNVIAFSNGRNKATIDQANIFIYGSANPAYAPVINNCDVSYSGRIMFRWSGSEIANISNITVSGGVATVTTAANHGLSTGNFVAVKLCNTTGLRTGPFGSAVTVTSATKFRYTDEGAADGVYTSATDPDLVIGTQSQGISLLGTFGGKINSLYCENAMGMALYVGQDNRALTVSGGFVLNCPVMFDNAGECEIGGVHFQGNDAVLLIAEANQRATVNFKRSSCSFTSGASISRGAYYMEDGRRYGPAIPTTGTWLAGEELSNSSFNSVGGVFGWRCITAGTPGEWVTLGQAPATSGNWGDAAVTLTTGASYTTNLWLSPLTANRAVTLSTSNTFAGAKFRIVRGAAATGAFSLNVGSGPLKALAVGQWCDVEYDGGAWRLTAWGSL